MNPLFFVIQLEINGPFVSPNIAMPNSPGGASQGAGGSSSSSHGVVDPAAVLRIQLDPYLKKLPTSHWAFELVQAILGGDTEMVRLITSSHQTRWNTQLLTEPLGGTLGQNLLHIAALQNRAAICGLFLQSLDKEADEQAELVLKSG